VARGNEALRRLQRPHRLPLGDRSLYEKRVIGDNFEDLFYLERSERANKRVANYLTGFLGLPPSAIGYVTEAGRDDLTLLSLERGKEHGIEFERISIPAYNPLP
jgi:hypothetical protein